MSQTRLIVNADDFGRSPGVSNGILRAHEDGIVSTTTAIINIDNSIQETQIAHERCPALGLGVHLNITFGKPLSQPENVQSLLTLEGRFRNFRDLMNHPETIDTAHAEREWRLQIETFLETGVPLDHLDSHHHSAVFCAELFDLMLKLASEYDCGVRNPNPVDLHEVELHDLYTKPIIDFVRGEAKERLDGQDTPHPDGFLASFFAGKATASHLEALLTGLKAGTYELMCHPGLLDAKVAEESSYAKLREQELDVLTDPGIRLLLDNNNIELHTYRTAWTN